MPSAKWTESNPELVKMGKEILNSVRRALIKSFPSSPTPDKVREYNYSDAETVEFYFRNHKIYLITRKNLAFYKPPPDLVTENPLIWMVKKQKTNFQLHDPNYINAIVDWFKNND